MPLSRLVLVVAIALLMISPAEAAVRYPQRFDTQPKHDLVASGFINATTRSAASVPTTARFSYDDKNLYVDFHCDQGGIPITATQTTNSLGFGTDDFVGVGIDTSGSGSKVYFFEATPAGTRYQQASETSRYEPVWTAVTKRTDSGWEAHLSIPLEILRIPPASSQTWRINFIRGLGAKAEHLTWAWDDLMMDMTSPMWPMFSDAR